MLKNAWEHDYKQKQHISHIFGSNIKIEIFFIFSKKCSKTLKKCQNTLRTCLNVKNKQKTH